MNAEHEGVVIASLKTSLSNSGKVSGHHVYPTLTNIALENR